MEKHPQLTNAMEGGARKENFRLSKVAESRPEVLNGYFRRDLGSPISRRIGRHNLILLVLCLKDYSEWYFRRGPCLLAKKIWI